MKNFSKYIWENADFTCLCAKHSFVTAHLIAEQLGPIKSAALPGFHAFTGCDTVSSFSGRGKKTVWDTWLAYPEVTRAFTLISLPVIFIPDDVSHIFERFVVLMYRRTSSNSTVNQKHKELFTSLNRSIDNIPPTSAALTQHVLRAAYQAGHCWGQALSSQVKSNWLMLLICRVQISGAGSVSMMSGFHCGQCCQRHPWPAENCWVVVASVNVRLLASVWRQTCHARRCACV